MGQVLHGSATTTHAIRAAIQRFKFTLNGRLRPDPASELARLARMTSKRLSKMEATATKRDITNSPSPGAMLGHHAPSARISAAC
jgi:hypothetical protein